MKHLTPLLLLAAALMAACSDNEQFRVNGVLADKATMNMRVGYYADGAYRTIVTAAREGEFEFYGSSKTPTLVNITDYEYRPLVSLYAVNGETYQIKLDRSRPFAVEISGNDVNQQWSAFLRSKADSLAAGPEQANAAVAAYIRANPDKTSSTILLLTAYDSSRNPAEAAELLGIIAPQAQPSSLTDSYMASLQRVAATTDSIEVMAIPCYVRRGKYLRLKPSDAPYTLMAFSDRPSRTDRIPQLMRQLHSSHGDSSLALADISLDGDTADWRYVTRPDSADWLQVWAAGSVSAIGIDRLAIPSLPYFIICDSLGRQLYRGTDSARARALADSLKNIP